MLYVELDEGCIEVNLVLDIETVAELMDVMLALNILLHNLFDSISRSHQCINYHYNRL